MKHILYILVFAVGFAVAFVSCENFDVDVSSVTLTVPSANVVVPYSGGVVSVGYRVGYAKDGAYLLASTEQDWISDFDFSVADTVTFFVAENYERVPRYGSVELFYMVEADTLVSNTVHVSQEYYSYYVFEPAYASGRYYGMTNYYNNYDIMQYSLYLSDSQIDEYGVFTEGATYYFLNFWTSSEVEGLDFVLLPTGTYSSGQVGQDWIVSDDSQYFVMQTESDEYYEDYSDSGDIVGGNLTVTRSGGITTIAGTLEDNWGGVHDISYSGELSFENEGLVSLLDGDMAVGDLSGVACEAHYYGDYYQTGTSNWLLYIYPEIGTGFVIDVSASASYDLDAGVPVGTFYAFPSGGTLGTFLYGTVFSDYLSGTWLVSFDEEGALTSPYAPICDGVVEISASGEGYTVTIDAYDDRQNRITGSWTGVPTVSDRRTSTSSLSRSGIRLLR